MKILQAIALLAVSWLCCESALTVRYARQRSVYTFDKLNSVLRETSQTLDELRKGATTWESASKEQASKTSSAMSNVSVAAARLSSFVSNLDISVNSQLLPAATKAVNEQNQSLLETQKSLQQNLSSTLAATQQAQKVLIDADAQITNPALKQSVDSLAEAAQNTAESTKQVQLAITDVRQIADKARETYLKPVNLWWGLVKEFLPLAGSAAQVFK